VLWCKPDGFASLRWLVYGFPYNNSGLMLNLHAWSQATYSLPALEELEAVGCTVITMDEGATRIPLGRGRARLGSLHGVQPAPPGAPGTVYG